MFKRIKTTLLLTAYTSLMALSLVATSSRTHAAACTTTATYGSVSMTAAIPATGEYVVWARFQVAGPTGTALLVEVNGDTCFSVGNSSVPANTWTWLNYQGSTTSNTMKYTFSSAGAKTIKVIGQQADVKIDKLLFMGTSEQCSANGSTPSGDGTNCDTGVAATPASQPTDPAGTQTTTPSIVASQPENVEKVEYYVNGTLIQSANKPAGFDTTLVENGTYELVTKVAYKDGTTAEAKQELTVNNPPQALGTVRRWMKRNKQVVAISIGVVSIGGTLGLVYFGLQMMRHKKLYLIHHGLTQ